MRPLIEELEPRLLYSADLAPVLGDALSPQIEQRLIGDDGEFAPPTSTPMEAHHTRFEVVFIDLRVQDYAQIVADIQQQNTDGRSIEVVLLDTERDGIVQIGDFLGRHQDVDAVHIISHGSAGAVQLGAGLLDFDSLLKNASDIKQWGQALSDKADILIYGCDLAASEEGQSLIGALGRLTGADVAASDDATGAARLGGDYDLEYSVGAVESRGVFSAAAQQSWAYVLAAPIAVSDAASTTENGVLTVGARGVLANDTNPDTASVTAGATLNFTTDGDDVWTNQTSVTGFDWTIIELGTQSTYTTAPTTAYPGIASAYQFSGTNSGATMPRMDGLPGDPTNNSASFEIWFRPDVLSTSSGQRIIFETGDVNGGTSLYLDNTLLKFATRNSGMAADEVSVDLAALYASPTSEFIQAIGVIDQVTEQLKLYVDGQLRATQNLAGMNGTDWAGPDGAGLGKAYTNSSTAPAAGSGTLDGDIAIFRLYEKALTASEATSNFTAITNPSAGLVVSQVEGSAANVGNQLVLASGALLRLNADGAYTYNPNNRFEYLSAGQTANDAFSYTATNASGSSATTMVKITVNGANDAPTATNLSAAETYTEDTPLNLTDIVVSDVDSANVTATLTLSNVAAGSLNTATSGAVTSTFANGVWTASGAVANVNALLAGLTFTPAADFNANFSISTRVSDGVAPALTGSKAFTGIATNDAPTDLSTGIELNLDGGNDAYLVDNTSGVPYWEGFTGITMEFTVSDLQVPSAMTTFYSKSATGSASYFAVQADGTLTWTGFNSTGKYTQLFDGGLHTVAFTWSPPSGALSFYIDGALVESRATSTQATTKGGGVFVLGQKQNEVGGGFIASQAFSGSFHDVRIWNHVRSAADIAANDGYRLDLTATQAAQSGLVANWQMDGFSAGQLIDSTNGYVLGIAHATGTGYTASTPADRPAVAENAANGTQVAHIVPADKDRGDTHAFSLTDAAGGRFAINAVTGKITVANATLLDFETASSHAVNVRVTDAAGMAYQETVVIRVTDVNEAPVATNLNTSEIYTEDTSLNLTDIVVSDVDSANVTVTLTLSNAVAGTLNTATSGTVTSTFANGVWTASGAIANVNALLAGLTFTPAVDFNANFSIATSVSDGVAAPLTGSKAFTGTPVNDAPSFGYGDGAVTTDFGAGDIAYAVAVQPDGKIVLAGSARVGGNDDFALTRYNSDGSLDTSFGIGGKVTTAISTGTDWAHGVAVQPDGKIVVVGRGHNGLNWDVAVVRYHADGSLDTSFGAGGTGIVRVDIGGGNDVGNMVALQGDGKIVVSARARIGSTDDFAVVRLNADGTLDTGFNATGKVTTAIGPGNESGQRVTLQADGKIVVSGYSSNGSNNDFAVVRYHTDGTLDTGFGGTGIVTTSIGAGNDSGSSAAVQADGKIVVAGVSYNGNNDDFAIVRYHADGTLDTGFGSGGIVITPVGAGNDQALSVRLQDDGRIVVGGFALVGGNSDFAVLRYHSDGSLDTSFGGDGKTTVAVGPGNDSSLEMALQPDGRIVLAGRSSNGANDDFAVVRVGTDGTPDTGFDQRILNGRPRYTEDGAAVILDNDVQIFDAELSPADNFAGAILTLSRNGGASAQDVFSATGNLAPLAQGGNLILSGIAIGTVTTNSAGSLQLLFNGNATQARVNETLQSIAYANSSDTPPASAQIDWVFDDGNTGAQGSGGARAATGSTIVGITPVNDAPDATNLNAAETYTEDTPLNLTDIVVSDVDSANVSVTLTLSNAAAGSLNTATSGAVTSSFASGVWSASGAVADINTLLAALTFTPAPDFNGSFAIDIMISDGAAAITGIKSMTGTAVNDAPTAASTMISSGEDAAYGGMPSTPMGAGVGNGTPVPSNPVSQLRESPLAADDTAVSTSTVAVPAGDAGNNPIASAVASLDAVLQASARLPTDPAQDDTPYTQQLLTSPEMHGDLLLRLVAILYADPHAMTGNNQISPAVRVEITSEETFRAEIISRGAEITAASLSVGAVWWALRAGGLFASLLTSMPAWRSFDLLPVLNRNANDNDVPCDKPLAESDAQLPAAKAAS